MLYGAESLHLKGARLYDGQGGNEFQRRIYHSPNDARKISDSSAVARMIPDSPTVARRINPGPPPNQPYLDKLLRLVSRVNEQHANEQMLRNLKVLNEQERDFMSHDDVEVNNQNAKEEENRKTGSRAFASAGVSRDGRKLAKEDESKEHLKNFNLERKENKEGDDGNDNEEEEQEEDDENEEQEEEEGEISTGKDDENNEDKSSEEIIEEEEKESKNKNKPNEDKKGKKSENKENADDDKRRLMTLLMRELKDLETENSQIR